MQVSVRSQNSSSLLSVASTQFPTLVLETHGRQNLFTEKKRGCTLRVAYSDRVFTTRSNGAVRFELRTGFGMRAAASAVLRRDAPLGQWKPVSIGEALLQAEWISTHPIRRLCRFGDSLRGGSDLHEAVQQRVTDVQDLERSGRSKDARAGVSMYPWPIANGQLVKLHAPHGCAVLFRGDVLHAGRAYPDGHTRAH